MLRYLTAGESHGQALVGILEGMPAGLALRQEHIDRQLRRRQLGYGRGGRMAIEADQAALLSGVRHGRTLGSPIALLVENRDWEHWRQVMAVEAGQAPPVTLPRPGHADFAGAIKYGQVDIRNVLERASARETAVRVALGAVARQLLEEFGITLGSVVTAIGLVAAPPPEHSPQQWEQADQSPVRCLHLPASRRMMAAIDKAREAGDSLGGVFEVCALGVPVGLGSHVHWDRRLDGRLAGAVMAIPAIKGVEIGLGFAGCQRPGSQFHDGFAPGGGRLSNHAGGLEGGISNGQPLLLRAAMKPIPTLTSPLPSVDLATGEARPAHAERSDVCAVPAAAVVAEAVVALELAAALTERLGGDSLEQMQAHYRQLYGGEARR